MRSMFSYFVIKMSMLARIQLSNIYIKNWKGLLRRVLFDIRAGNSNFAKSL